MNKTKYLQRDGRWGGLPYPKKPCYIRDVGCGEVSIANIIIEMERYKNYTPTTIQPYCKQYGSPNCNGTYLSGICKMMKHYGLTDVKECDTMPELWRELAKGDRVAIYLMGSRPGGSKGVHWTSGGHFVSSVAYKYEDKLHKVYVKDPWTDAANRNGWLSYEEHMKGDVVAVYVGKLVGKKATTPTTADGQLTIDGIGGEATIKATQKFFGTNQSGVISGQMKKLAVYYPGITAVNFGNGGSPCIKALQKWLGLTEDGIIGQGTTAAWQKRLRDLGYLAKDETIDGIFGVKSVTAWQKFLNDKLSSDNSKPTTPTTPSADNNTGSNEKKAYSGEMPSLLLRKNNAEVRADAARFATIIATDNIFHYGHGKDAHHNGCYYCGTQPKSKRTSGIKDWKLTYCCNPFVHACFAHGGCSPKALEMCQKGKSWAFDKGQGYDASPLFKKLGKPKKSSLEKGDVLCTDTHIAIYVGDGKIAEAASEDNNVKNSSSWNNSIHITTLTDKRYRGFKRVYRYKSSISKTMNIIHGEISRRVELLQQYLKWYGCEVNTNGFFNSKTLEAVKKFQKENGLTVNGIVDSKTLEAMKKVVK